MNLSDISEQAREALFAEAYARARRRVLKDESADPIAYAERNLSILTKDGRITSLRYNAAQRAYLANRTRRDLILKARQLGMSTCIQAEHFRLTTTQTAIAATLAHDHETTQKLRRMVDRYYKYLPNSIKPHRKYNNSKLMTFPDSNSEMVIGTAGNTEIGRGGTYTHIHCSEVAFFKDAESIMAGILQGGNPSIVLESTPNGAQGWFYNACMEALDGNGVWRLHFFPWWIDPEYRMALDEGETLTYTDDEARLAEKQSLTPEQIKWRRSKQIELKHLFIQEYPEDAHTCFLRSGFGYFGDLTDVFKAPLNAQPDTTHRYVAGLDFGQTVDWTVLSVMDATTRVQVDLVRINRLPWKEMRRQVIAACKRWGVKALKAEANSMGTTNSEALRSEAREAGVSMAIYEFDTSNASKASIMGALHEGMHNQGLKLLPIIEQQHEFNAFTATQLPSFAWKLAAPDGEHDDTVIATAIAWDEVVRGTPSSGRNPFFED